MFKSIIKRVITPEEYEQKTGQDLSHTDMKHIRCLEVDEEPHDVPDRSTAFKLAMRKLIDIPYKDPLKSLASLSIVTV